MGVALVEQAWEPRAACQEEPGKRGRCRKPGVGVSWVACLQKLCMISSFNWERQGREATARPSGKRLTHKGSRKMKRGEAPSLGLGSHLDTGPCRQAPGSLLWIS